MRSIIASILIGATGIALAQPVRLAPHPVFDATTVATVHVTIHPDSLARILDPVNADSDHEYPSTVVFENELIRDSLVNVGFRLRGNTSRDSKKKSFKVSINAFQSGQTFAGLEKLNLNGEHNDPTIVRAKLAWDLFHAAGIPASRAAHARLFINGEYRGLYLNVEHVDEQFVKPRFGNNDGSLYKCLWPADLTYRGEDPELYKFTNDGRRTYELHITDEADDYRDLARFIAAVNQTPDGAFVDSISRVFNINSLLRVLAVDIAVASWDNYWFLKNNFYLYRNTATGLFECIPYDYDNTFGIWWSGILSGVDWSQRNVYAWGHPSEPRPLVRRLLAVPEFRARLTFYLRRLLTTAYTETALAPAVDSLHALITSAAEADLYRTQDYGFTIQQFHDSFTQALGGHVTAGLKPFIIARRTSALSQLDPSNVPPILSDFVQTPAVPAPGSPVSVRVFVEDETAPDAVALTGVIGDSLFQLPMFDDGAHGDGQPGDGVFGVSLAAPPSGKILRYWVEALDAVGQVTREPYGARERTVTSATAGPRLLINEFMAKNETTILDAGAPDDWVEVFNAEPETLQLSSFTLTDNLANPTKWRFPSMPLPPGGRVLVWADEEGAQGPLHANFKLDKDGEDLGIFYTGSGAPVACDTIMFGLQSTDASTARIPDGGAWQVTSSPSPGQPNVSTSISDAETVPGEIVLEPAYPNPFNPATQVRFQIAREGHVRLSIFDLLGREVDVILDGEHAAGVFTVTWRAERVPTGVYVIVLRTQGHLIARRVSVVR